MTEETQTSGRREPPSRTRGERVRTAARTLREPRTATWVAKETEVSLKTAQKYLDQLRVHLSMSDNTDDNSQNGSEGSSEGTGPILAGQQVSKGARRTRSGSNG